MKDFNWFKIIYRAVGYFLLRFEYYQKRKAREALNRSWEQVTDKLK